MTPVAESDQGLLEGIRERDSAAFEELFERYQGLVRWHLQGIVHDQDSVEDLVQEVFLRVWTHGDQWDGRGPFKAWLLRVSTNLGLNLLRTLKRRKEQVFESPPEPDWENDDSPVPGWMIDSVSSRPDIAFEIAERRETLWRFVDDLPEEKRDVIRLIHESDMEIREVAEALGVPEGTVKSRLHHARRRLAYKWRDYESGWEV